MGKTVTVTIIYDTKNLDLELPADILLCDLYPRLLSVLKRIDRSAFYEWTGILLEYEGGGLLNKNATLLDYGIRSGSLLEVVKEEKYNGFNRN